MSSKSQWSTNPVVFFNPSMLLVTKGDTYLLEALVEDLLPSFATTIR